MNNFEFQIVCIDCGCLAIKIEDPVKAPREATVYCGDCGAARGTVGALRDLAVQTNSNVPTGSHHHPKTVAQPMIRSLVEKSRSVTTNCSVSVNR